MVAQGNSITDWCQRPPPLRLSHSFPFFSQLAAQQIGSGTAAEITLPTIEVTATPLPGGGVDRDKIPATVHSVIGEDFARNPPATITETLFQLVPGLSVSDPNGNTVSQELNFRGFSASSLQGAPRGSPST